MPASPRSTAARPTALSAPLVPARPPGACCSPPHAAVLRAQERIIILKLSASSRRRLRATGDLVVNWYVKEAATGKKAAQAASDVGTKVRCCTVPFKRLVRRPQVQQLKAPPCELHPGYSAGPGWGHAGHSTRPRSPQLKACVNRGQHVVCRPSRTVVSACPVSTAARVTGPLWSSPRPPPCPRWHRRRRRPVRLPLRSSDPACCIVTGATIWGLEGHSAHDGVLRATEIWSGINATNIKDLIMTNKDVQVVVCALPKY